MDNDDYTAKMTELIALLRAIGNDTQQCEVKECKRRISSTITETLSAFSNGNGGYIILGLSEKAGFTPVEGFDARAMQEALSQACEKLTPVAGQGQRLDAVLEGEDAIDDVDDWPDQHRGNHRADADAAQPVEEDQ